MEKVPSIAYGVPLLLLLLILASSVIGLDIIDTGSLGVFIWFTTGILAAGTGYATVRIFGWKTGFTLIAVTALLASAFGAVGYGLLLYSKARVQSSLPVEMLALFVRDLLLGVFAVTGALAAERSRHSDELTERDARITALEETQIAAQEKADILIEKAEVQARGILSDAKAELERQKGEKERVERELKQLVRSEIELLKKYE